MVSAPQHLFACQVTVRLLVDLKAMDHPCSDEAEVKVAMPFMQMAAKLMQSQTVTQADLIANKTEKDCSSSAWHKQDNNYNTVSNLSPQ